MGATESLAFLNDAIWNDKIFNGEWIAAEGGTQQFSEPATGHALGSIGKAGAQDIARAAKEARAPRKRPGPPPITRRGRDFSQGRRFDRAEPQ